MQVCVRGRSQGEGPGGGARGRVVGVGDVHASFMSPGVLQSSLY